MAKAIAAKKKKTARATRRGINRFALMPTDSWFKAKHFVHYEIESKEWLTVVKDYIRKNYDRKIVANINRLPDWKVGGGSHWAATAALLEKNPSIVPEQYSTGICKFVQKLAAEGESVTAEKIVEEKPAKSVVTPTIQDRINDQVDSACAAIEQWLEGFVVDKKTFDPKGFDFTAHFSNMKVSQAHARKIAARYAGELEEARLIASMPTAAKIAKIQCPREKDYAEQLHEGYSHIDKKSAQAYLTALETLAGACALVIDASKATRKPRAKKALSKEKLVAKLKYKVTDEKYQIASVNPVDIVDAVEVWIFNTKTRKLGKYVAEEHATIKVKGTTLQFYDETKSVQKTLRKPEETLKEFKHTGKVALRKFLDNINSVETKLNGRLNSDTVILRVT